MSAQQPDMESEISDTTLTGSRLSLRRTAFVNSTLSKLNITTSTLTTCSLSNCTISTSTIKDCTLSNCNITNSTLHESPFVKSKLSGCQVTTSPLALRRFPTELRDMIFKDCLQIEEGKSPALLIALRGDKELYEEALEVYYKTNYCSMGKAMIQRINDLSPKAISRIKDIRIL